MVKAWSSIVKAVTDLPDNFPIQQQDGLFFKIKLKRLPNQTTYLFVELRSYVAGQ